MIILKHCKRGDMSYVAHKDALKTLQRSLRRANFAVNFSQGFNPHMLTYMSTPVPLGTQSESDYFVIDCKETDAQDFLTRFNQATPSGLVAIKAWFLPKNPNIAAAVVASKFCVKLTEKVPQSVMDIMLLPSYFIDIVKKDETISKDVRSLVFAIELDGDDLILTLGCGNDNLRIDSFMQSLKKNFDLNSNLNNITRVAQYALKDGKLVDIEQIFE